MLFYWLALGFWIASGILLIWYKARLPKRVTQNEELIGLARQKDIEDPGKEAVLTDPGTKVDYDKGLLWFKCQSCQYYVTYIGDVEIPKGGLCASCSGDREWMRWDVYYHCFGGGPLTPWTAIRCPCDAVVWVKVRGDMSHVPVLCPGCGSNGADKEYVRQFGPWRLFRCSGCGEHQYKVGSSREFKDGQCPRCAVKSSATFCKTLKPDKNGDLPPKTVKAADAGYWDLEVSESGLIDQVYRKRVAPDKNGDPPALKDLDEELADKRADIAREHAHLNRRWADLARARAGLERARERLESEKANLPAYAERLDKQKERLDGRSKSLSNREHEVRAKENAVTEREERVKLNLPALNTPAWARDALWGMGLSGIGLAFAWVATLIF